MSRISRRSLLTSGAAAGVLAASGIAVQAKPRRGGILRAGIAGGSAIDTWDSRDHRGLFMLAAAHGAVFDCLTEIGADGALKGELAESWEASADARIWTFDLRRGVQFHNGKSFGADDVIESLSLHIGTHSPAAPLLSAVTEIRKVTDHQVQFHLNAPNADFPYLLADYHLIIYPAGLVELAMINGIGTGLYRVENFQPGTHLFATRTQSHYKGESAGFFDELALTCVTDGQSGMQALCAGQLDALGQVPEHLAKAGLQNGAVTLHRHAGNRHFGFALNANAAQFGDPVLRRALKSGLDRDAFVKNALLDQGRIAADSPIGPANQYFEASLDPIAFDPDQARYHLSRAGIDRIDIALPDNVADADGLAPYLVDQMKGLGLKTRVQKTQTLAAITAHTSSGRATEDWVLSTYLTKGSAWNASNWFHPQLENLILAARSEMDSTRRRQHYQDAQQLLRDDAPVLIPAFADHLFATSKTLMSPPSVGSQWGLDNARIAERWWHVGPGARRRNLTKRA